MRFVNFLHPRRALALLLGSRERKLVFFALLAVFLGTVYGSLGYELIEGWSFIDSVYMTVITMASVGYGETHPLSPTGRLFTISLIGYGMITAGFVVAVIVHVIIDRDILRSFVWRKMQRKIDALSSHTIFCGYGRFSRFAIAELSDTTNVVIIEHNPHHVLRAEEAGLLVISGDATNEDVLKMAGIDRARRLISLLPKSSDNLFVILTAKETNSDIYIVSRAEEEGDERRLLRAGANRVVAPYRIGGHLIAERLKKPHVRDFLELTSTHYDGDIGIEEISVPVDSTVSGKSLRDSGIRSIANTIVAAVVRPDGNYIFNPGADVIIEGGSTLIIMGVRNELQTLEKLFRGA